MNSCGSCLSKSLVHSGFILFDKSLIMINDVVKIKILFYFKKIYLAYKVVVEFFSGKFWVHTNSFGVILYFYRKVVENIT